MNNINDETEKSNNSGPFPTILFICNIIVIANTKQSVFEDLDHGSYYNLILFSLIATGILTGLSLVSCCGVLVSISQENNTCCLGFIQLATMVIALALLIGYYYYIGVIWHDDPSHSVLFYGDFWTNPALDFNHHGHHHGHHHSIDHKWAYVMTDVLVRIYSTILLFFTIIGLPLLACFGGLVSCFKQDDDFVNPKGLSASHFSSSL